MALFEDVEHGGHGGQLARGKGDEGAEGDEKKDKDPKGHRQQLILIVIGIVGAFFTYLIWRSRQTQNSAGTATTTSGYPTSGNVAGGPSGDPYLQQQVGTTLSGYGTALTQLQNQQQADEASNQNAMSGFASLLTTLQQEVSQMAATPSTAPPQTPILPNLPNTVAQPPPLPAGTNLIGKLIAVVTQAGGQGADYITSSGAVYTSGSAGYYGGSNQDVFGAAGTDIVAGGPLAGGGYYEQNRAGNVYNFGPQAGQTNTGPSNPNVNPVTGRPLSGS